MEHLLRELYLGSSDDDSEDENVQLEPLTGKELHLMNIIRAHITKGKYKDISLLFTSNRHAPSNNQILPKIWMHLLQEVCKKYITSEVYDTNKRLFKCAEHLLKRIADCAPAEEFLMEVFPLLFVGEDNSMFEPVVRVLASPLLRLPDTVDKDRMHIFKECFDEIELQRDVLPTPEWLVLGLIRDTNGILDEDIRSIDSFYKSISELYSPLLRKVCAEQRPRTEIFRLCIANKRNVLCGFLLKMLDTPLALFNLRNGSQGFPFYAFSLTTAVTKCIVDPFFFLNFVEEKRRSEMILTPNEEIFSNHFLNVMEPECLVIYYYMIIVQKVCSRQVPLVYNPLYVCEKVITLVHHVLTGTVLPALKEKALTLATEVLKKLAHIKLSSSHLEDSVFKDYLNDLRNMALAPVTPFVLLYSVAAMQQFILCFLEEDKYTVLKNLMRSVNHAGFCGFLVTMYKDLAAQNLEQVLNGKHTLSPIYMGEHLRAILLEDICKLPSDPIEDHDFLIAALETIEMFAKKDTNNITGFWTHLIEIKSQFILPLANALQAISNYIEGEIVNSSKDCDKKRRSASKNKQHPINKENTKKLKKDLLTINKLKIYLTDLSKMLADAPVLGDKNNNEAKNNSVETK